MAELSVIIAALREVFRVTIRDFFIILVHSCFNFISIIAILIIINAMIEGASPVWEGIASTEFWLEVMLGVLVIAYEVEFASGSRSSTQPIRSMTLAVRWLSNTWRKIGLLSHGLCLIKMNITSSRWLAHDVLVHEILALSRDILALVGDVLRTVSVVSVHIVVRLLASLAAYHGLTGWLVQTTSVLVGKLSRIDGLGASSSGTWDVSASLTLRRWPMTPSMLLIIIQTLRSRHVWCASIVTMFVFILIVEAGVMVAEATVRRIADNPSSSKARTHRVLLRRARRSQRLLRLNGRRHPLVLNGIVSRYRHTRWRETLFVPCTCILCDGCFVGFFCAVVWVLDVARGLALSVNGRSWSLPFNEVLKDSVFLRLSGRKLRLKRDLLVVIHWEFSNFVFKNGKQPSIFKSYIYKIIIVETKRLFKNIWFFGD